MLCRKATLRPKRVHTEADDVHGADRPGLTAEESARLQRWFADELLPLTQADGRPSVEVKTEL